MSDRRFAKQIQIQNFAKCTRRTSTLNEDSNSDSHRKVKYIKLIVNDLAQSATQKRTPLGREPFWEKVHKKPEKVQLPLEPIYENTITSSSAQSERERLARNAQLKMNWENRCQKQMEIGIRWRQTMDSGRPHDSINAISEFAHRRKTHHM